MRLMGGRLWSAFAQALDEPAPVSIRVNPLKHGGWEDARTEAVPWCPYGLYLPERPEFTADPLFHAGAYYVQEASSMFLHCIMSQYVRKPVLMLDLCAAPGGKSTLARAALPEGSLLVCNDTAPARAATLSENMQKWGHPGIIITNNRPADFSRAGMVFDVILADMPCSGEGMFRKDSGAMEEWSERNVEKCRNTQRAILRDIWPCLRAGGLLIYSTCTYNEKENEENVMYAAQELGAAILPVETGEAWGITGSLCARLDAPVYRFIPGMTRGEGLFMALLRKHGDTPPVCSTAPRGHSRHTPAHGTLHEETAREWIADDDGAFTIQTQGGTVTAMPRPWGSVLDTARSSLRVIHAGITVGAVKGRSMAPAHSLAMSACINAKAFTAAEIGHAQALDFLCRKPVPLPAGTPEGYVLMTYKGHALGFEKNLRDRANNLYPAAWRIRNDKYLKA